MAANSSRRIRKDDLVVDRSGTRVHWRSGADRIPRAKDRVYCTEGMAEVIKVHGRISDGSRLLELRLLDIQDAPPFFAAASNVLVQPRRVAS
jgi:hypothetical protein